MQGPRKLGVVSTFASLLVLAGLGNSFSAAQANTLVNESGTLGSGDAVLDDGSLYDQYTFEANGGQYATIFLGSEDFDPYLILLAPNGERISENDDISRVNRNSILMVALPTTGVYTAVANSYESGRNGSYVIKVGVGDSPASLTQILAAAAVPEGTAACRSTIVNLVRELERDRDLEVLVSSLPLERLYAQVPSRRPDGVSVSLSGTSALSVMFSPELLAGLSGGLIRDCDSVGGVTFDSDSAEFERTFGVMAESGSSAGPDVVEFYCERAVPADTLPPWGERACL
ncbi:MAG: hypothetical protein AAFU53_10625 [Cyanobacteria bacterium J06632_3]